MAGQLGMTIKSYVFNSTESLFRSSDNQINLKKSNSLYFPVSGFNRTTSIRQNTTSVSFHCRSTKDENYAETSLCGAVKDALSAFSKLTHTSLVTGFISSLYFESHRTKPMNVSFNELMGVDDIILEFQDIISMLHRNGDCKKSRESLPNGVLLYGPPGTGKSTVVHAMAREAKVPFFSVSACYIASGHVRIRSLFNEARRCSPSIVFIEDVDEIASPRENCESDPYLIELHTEMEKCNKDGSMVVVIAATDSLETLDPAFMSSRQFYKTFYLAKPDEDSRRKKVHLYYKDYIMEEDKEAICNLVASKTSGLVWANLKSVVVQSRVAANWRGGDRVTMDDVLHAIRRLDEYIRVMKVIELHNNPCDS